MPWILISKKGGTISCPRQFLQLKNVVHYRTYHSTLKKSELAFYRNYLLPTIYKNRHKLEKNGHDLYKLKTFPSRNPQLLSVHFS